MTILNIIPLTERTFQSRKLTFLRKSSSVSSFLLPASSLHSVQSFFYCSVRLYQRTLLFALLTGGKGSRTDMYAEIFTTFCLLIFKFFFFLENLILPTTFTHTHTHDPHPRPTTSTHYPRPTTFSYTREAVLQVAIAY